MNGGVKRKGEVDDAGAMEASREEEGSLRKWREQKCKIRVLWSIYRW